VYDDRKIADCADNFYELDELDVEDELELESLSESDVSLDELDDDDESLSLDELEPEFFGDPTAFDFDFFAGGSSVSAFLRFLFKIFVRLSLITILRLFLHS
jgi:hypothetical protein